MHRWIVAGTAITDLTMTALGAISNVAHFTQLCEVCRMSPLSDLQTMHRRYIVLRFGWVRALQHCHHCNSIKLLHRAKSASG